MKVLKKLKKLIVINLIAITIIFSLIPPKVSYGITNAQGTVGNAITATANDFFNRFASQTIYDYGYTYTHPISGEYVEDSWSRKMAYENTMTSGYGYYWGEYHYYENKFAMDCVGFVSMIIHRATGLGGSSFSYFGVPQTCYGNDYTHFDELSGVEAIAGDIISWGGHVGIAIGGGYMIDSCHMGPNGEITKRPISNYSDATTGHSYTVLRIKSSVAESLVSSGALNTTWYPGTPKFKESPGAGTTGGNGGSSSTNPNPGSTSNPGDDVIDDSEKYEIVRHGYGDSDKFYYNGMPLSGNYLGRDKSNWLIDALANVADWLVGIITMGYKIQIVGWTSIFQNIATDVVNKIVNEDANKKITAETILFNQIQILDVNFFNFDTAGGEHIEPNDITYILKQNVAGLYFSIRSIAIIVMLVILIYVGIRMALSTVTGDKAKYKRIFLSWVVGFIVIMFIHYFMSFIINANEQIISWMKPADNATVIYDEVRSYAYEIPASKGWTGTIMYVFLIYYMIKLLLFYFKRLLVVYVLSIMGPILGIMYAIEKVKGKSKSLTTWMKEFAFNILIQSIHVIIYCLFMNIIYSFMKTTSIGKLIPYAIIMVLILNLMLKSEKIIKKIFGLKSSTIKDITDTVLQTSGSLMTAYAIAKPVYNYGKKKVVNAYDKGIENGVNNRYKHLENSLAEVENSKLATDIQKEIDKLKQQEIADRKAYNKNALDLSKNILGGMRGLVTSVPVMFEAGPAEGTLSIIGAASDLNSRMKKIKDSDMDEDRLDELLRKYNMAPVSTQAQAPAQTNGAGPNGAGAQPGGRPIRTFDTTKNKNYTVAKGIGGFALASATAGTSTRVKNIWEDKKEETEKVRNPSQTTKIELLYTLQTKVLEEERKMNSSIETLRNSGFPPVYYTPSVNESSQTVSMNLKLREQYLNELETNLRQAMAGDPTVSEDVVARHISDQMADTGKTSLNLADLQKVLDEIVDETDFEVGTEFENNIRNEVKRNAMDAAEGNTTNINKDAIRAEVLQKVERALSNNNWDENASENEIERIVTSDVAEDVISNLSASELTSIITSAVNRKGSLKNKTVIPEFEPIVNSAAKIAEMNEDAAEISGEEYDAEELIETILNRNVSKSR